MFGEEVLCLNRCWFKVLRNGIYFLNFCRTLLLSASSGYTIGRLSFAHFLTSVIVIPIYLYFLQRFPSYFVALPLGRLLLAWTRVYATKHGKRVNIFRITFIGWCCCLGVFQDRGRRRDGTEPERETKGGVDQPGAGGQGMQYPVVMEDHWEQFPYSSLYMGYH